MLKKNDNKVVLVELQKEVNDLILEVMPDLKKVRFGGGKFNKKQFVNTACLELLKNEINWSQDISKDKKTKFLEMIKKL